MNTRQQTERDLKKEKRKLGTIEQMCQVINVFVFPHFLGNQTVGFCFCCLAFLFSEKKKFSVVDVQVVKHEGWERLYGGLTPSLVGTAASQVSRRYLSSLLIFLIFSVKTFFFYRFVEFSRERAILRSPFCFQMKLQL